MIPFLVACAMGFQRPAVPSLTEAQIAEKLRPIPIFIPVGEDNAPVMAAQKGKQTIGIFFGKDECDKFVAGLVKQPGMSKVRVMAASFGALAAPKGAAVAFVPIESENGKALSLLKVDKPSAKEFPGVPLFIVISKDGNYLTVTQKDATMIPLMFSWQEAEDMRRRASANMREGSQFAVKVTSLEQILGAMRNRPAADTKNLVFVPHRKSIDDYNKLAKPATGG